jgi:hypothetical protein
LNVMAREKLTKSEAARRANVTLRVLQGWIDSGRVTEYNYAGGGRPFVYWDDVAQAARVIPAPRDGDQDTSSDDRGT